MFDPKRRVRLAISAVATLLLRGLGSRRASVDGTHSTAANAAGHPLLPDHQQSAWLTRSIGRSFRMPSVVRRLFVLFIGSLVVLLGVILLRGDGYWSSGVDDGTAYFRIKWKPRSSVDVVRMLEKSVADSRSSWRCDDNRPEDDDALRRSDDDDDGMCQPKASTLAAAAAAHPTVYSTTGIDCKAMFRGEESEIQAARRFMDGHQREFAAHQKPTTRHLLNATGDCADFRRKRGYFTEPLSRVEAEFPIAYSILMYDNVPQIERLLRSIYQPQNFYCIHVDIKADKLTKTSMTALAKCFDNVFIASRLESVYWGHISIIYAEMNCLRDLLQYQWKYFINLSGFMFPAHSNRELVSILQLYDGANDIEGSYKRSDHFWMKARNAFHWRLSETFGTNLLTLIPKASPPYNVTIYKGSNQVALTRAFALYFMYSTAAYELIDWFADTLAPDEYIWPTLNHNPQLHAPGGYKGDPETKTFTARATIWLPIADQVDWSWSHWPCRGQWVREICIFGVGDLPWLYRRPELFVNKFYADFEPLAYDCMEELIYNRTVRPHIQPHRNNVADGYNGSTASDEFDEDGDTFDPTYYLRLPFVSNKTSTVVSLAEAIRFLERSR